MEILNGVGSIHQLVECHVLIDGCDFFKILGRLGEFIQEIPDDLDVSAPNKEVYRGECILPVISEKVGKTIILSMTAVTRIHGDNGYTCTTAFWDHDAKNALKSAYFAAMAYVKEVTGSDDFFVKNSFMVSVGPEMSRLLGSSLGAGAALCFLSVALNRSIPAIGVTGEIAASGRLHRIGAVKEKLACCARKHIKLCVPYDNFSECIESGLDNFLIVKTLR